MESGEIVPNYTFEDFISAHINQLQSSGVPPSLWNSLFNKLENGVAGSDEEDEDTAAENTPETWMVVVTAKDGIDLNDDQHIYLIDHAWTYRVSTARKQLTQLRGLRERMAQLMGISASADWTDDRQVSEILHHMWRFNQYYSIGGPFVETENSVPVWYIMDEFGSRIQHSDEPTFRLVPFFYLLGQMSYSLLFPLRDLVEGEEVTRDYLEGPTVDAETRRALKIPWEDCDMTHVDCKQREPGEEFFRSGRKEETLPDPDADPPVLPSGRKIRVFSEYAAIRDTLKHDAFEIVRDEKDADVLWYMYHFKEFRDLSVSSPNKFVNQFPFEHIITVKDLLAIVSGRSVPPDRDNFCSETMETFPPWLPTTFNLKTELPKFVSFYQQRQMKGFENYWICKPWNLARSLDIHVTDNLNYILRLPSTGPKIACKYITDPVLFPRDDVGGLVKFDVRYVLLLRSVSPLRVYAYDRFFLRFSNQPFSLDEFDNYEKHFTVMNYQKPHLRQMFCQDFIKTFEEHYSGYSWKQIEADIFSMLKSVFVAATSKPPPCGIAQSLQSRAMFAVDLMLKWDRPRKAIRPMLLEMNWSPDCQRACQYYPEFFDDVFSVLFLDRIDGCNVTLL